MIGPVLLLVPLSLGLCAAFTALLRRLALRWGFVDQPGGRKIHRAPKPLAGGVAIYLAIALPMVSGLLLTNALDLAPPGGQGAMDRALAAISQHLNGIRQQTPLAVGLLVALTCIHLLGLWDDRRAMGPYIKLIGQIAVASVLVIGFDLRALTILGVVPSTILTVLWIVGITNAFNFLDNMDGLAAGVAAVCTTAFLITTLLIGQWFVAAMLALLLGALVGFLLFNFNPASIFMGDSGSLLVGMLLGVLTVRTTYVRPGADWATGWYPLLAPLIVLAVPLYDLVVVSIIRISRGKSPFVGDTNHLSHRLVARGMSRRTAVLCIWLMTAATSVAAILLPHVQPPFEILIFVQTLLVLGLVALLEQHPLPAEPGTGDDRAGRDG